MIADEIIWAGNDEVGFHTSHRTIIRGKNDGRSNYGSATNKDIDVLVIANCVALENRIFLEHVCYNTSSMLLQLGMDLDSMAPKLVSTAPVGWPRDQKTWNDLRLSASPEIPICEADKIEGFDIDRFLRETFEIIWNKRDHSEMNNFFNQNLYFEGPTNRKFKGLVNYKDFICSLITVFPDLILQIDEIYWMGNEVDGYLSSTRWSATGTHKGNGKYGEPTDTNVQIWGITQNEVIGGRIINEWMLFNELDLMMQIAASR